LAIELGPQTAFNDQPYVEIELVEVLPDQTTRGIGPYGLGNELYPFNRLLLDTGANSAMVVSDAAADLVSHGYRTEGTYLEIGVAGDHAFDLSAPYQINFRGTDGITHTLPQTADQNRIMSDATVDLGGMPASLGGIPGLIGMPAMVGRVTTLDMRQWDDVSDLLEIEPLGVTFADAVPVGNGHRYSVPVDTRVTFDPRDGLPPGSPPDAPLPVWAPVPFLTVFTEFQGVRRAGSFLLDTGAQMTLISTATAFSLGLDEDGDGDLMDQALGTIPVGGVGGTVEAPLMVIHTLRIPTLEGQDLVWLDRQSELPGVAVLVADIAPGIDGVLGVDILTSGLDYSFDPVTWEFTMSGAPYFEQVHFDFRNLAGGSGVLYLDLNPMYDVTTPDASVLVTPTGQSTDVTEGGSGDTYEISLTRAPTADVTVSVAAPAGQLTVSPATVTFTPADWGPRTITVDAVDDGLREGPHLVEITHSVSSADARYDGLAVPSLTVQVTDNHPIAAFSASPTSASPTQPVAFDASGSTHGRPDRAIVAYHWDFGDGQTLSTISPTTTHAYGLFGTYTVTLTVTDDNVPARTDRVEAMIVVDQGNRAPVADAGGPYTIEEGQPLRLDAGLSSDWDLAFGDAIVAYAWDLDNDGLFDDAASADPQVEVPWALLAGRFTIGVAHPIAVRATDRFGATGEALTTLTVIAPQDAGQVDLLELAGQHPAAGPLWYELRTAHPGFLTVLANAAAPADTFGLALFDAALSPAPLAESAAGVDGRHRLDWLASAAGQTYYVRLHGTATDVDLAVVNLVQPNGNGVMVFGTAHDDQFEFAAGAVPRLGIDGVEYAIPGAAAVVFDGGSGDDAAVLTGTPAAEYAWLRPGSGSLAGASYSVRVANVADLAIHGEGGGDRARFDGVDSFEAWATHAVTAGQGFDHRVYGFSSVVAHARPGSDGTAVLHAASPADRYVGTAQSGALRGPECSITASGFATVIAQGFAGGNNVAYLYDTSQRDRFEAGVGHAVLSGGGRTHQVDEFRTVYAFATAGDDEARLHDTPGFETFVAYPTWAMLTGASGAVRATGFSTVRATSTAGAALDLAVLYDSDAADTFEAQGAYGAMTDHQTYSNVADGFARIVAFAQRAGRDTAVFRYASAVDAFFGTNEAGRLLGPGYANTAWGFEESRAYGLAGGGWDRGELFDSEGDDFMLASGNLARLTYGDGRMIDLLEMEWVRAVSNRGGQDRRREEAHDYLLTLLGPWLDA
jgi:PKD repeat protein